MAGPAPATPTPSGGRCSSRIATHAQAGQQASSPPRPGRRCRQEKLICTTIQAGHLREAPSEGPGTPILGSGVRGGDRFTVHFCPLASPPRAGSIDVTDAFRGCEAQDRQFCHLVSRRVQCWPNVTSQWHTRQPQSPQQLAAISWCRSHAYRTTERAVRRGPRR